MDVFIAGAGVGGLALASGLVAAGHRVRVLERAPDPRTDGAAVTIFSNGAAAPAGLGAPLGGLGGRLETLGFDDRRPAPFGAADLRVLHRRTGFPVATVPRAGDPRAPRRRAAGRHDRVRPRGRRRRGRPGGVRGHRRHRRHATRRRRGRRRRLPVGRTPRGPRRRRPPPRRWTTWQGLTTALPELAGAPRALRRRPGRSVRAHAGRRRAAAVVVRRAGADPRGPVVECCGRFAGIRRAGARAAAGVADADVRRYPHVLHGCPTAWGAGAPRCSATPRTRSRRPRPRALTRRSRTRGCSPGRSATPVTAVPSCALRARARPAGAPGLELAASEVTNRPPPARGRLPAGCCAPAGRARYLAVIRRCSSVLNDERI